MSLHTLRFTLLGTGSSGGVPRLGNDWGVCDPSEPKNRRLRCSALAELVDAQANAVIRVLIDTSPDMRQQLLREGVEQLDAVFITHDHADQTHGLDDIRALALRARKQIAIHMDEPTASTLVKKFDYCFKGKGGYPPILDLQPFLQINTDRLVHGKTAALKVTPIEQMHGRIISLGFRIGDLAYCNDVNELSDQSLEKLMGLNVLVVDALRYKPHPTHAHLEQTLSWIDELKPKRSVLTNLHIDMDYQTLRRELPENVEPGFDGMVLELPY